jgi:hypothetical protein
MLRHCPDVGDSVLARYLIVGELNGSVSYRNLTKGGAKAETFALLAQEEYTKKTAEVITDFSRSVGDKIALPIDSLHLRRLRFSRVDSANDVKRFFSTKRKLVFDTQRGNLYIDLARKAPGKTF